MLEKVENTCTSAFCVSVVIYTKAWATVFKFVSFTEDILH